jgi:hypothetical protein
MTASSTIYIRLKGEGVDVWRPVEAIEEEAGIFRILFEPKKEEDWEFPSGSRVRCGKRNLASGEVTVATKIAP